MNAGSLDQFVAGVARLPGDVQGGTYEVFSVAVNKSIGFGMDRPTLAYSLVIV